MPEQNNEEVLELDVDQLQELIGGSNGSDALPPFEIDFEDYDVEEFKRGVKETSYISGVITALFNAGFSEASVLDFILNKETIKHNLETAKINKDMSIEISKNQRIMAEKNEL